MKPRFSDDTVTLYAGDCREALAELAPASVDAVVTDPPYELNFMGRAWDSSGIAYDVDMWRQCWRALKPGGFIAAFGAPRTYHRLTCAIEDAGFEIRDSLHWITGQGFPKSRNVTADLEPLPRCICEGAEVSHDGGAVVDPSGPSSALGAAVRAEACAVSPTGVSAHLAVRLGSQPRSGALWGEGGVKPGDVVLAGQLDPVMLGAADVARSTQGGEVGQVVGGIEIQPESLRDEVVGEKPTNGAAVQAFGVSLDGAGGDLTPSDPLVLPLAPSPCGVPIAGVAGAVVHGHTGAGAVDAGVGPTTELVAAHGTDVNAVSGAFHGDNFTGKARGFRRCEVCGGVIGSVPQGLGSALKPAHEPIVLARKPLAGTVAGNVLTHGTGALNIDACRVPHARGENPSADRRAYKPPVREAGSWANDRRSAATFQATHEGEALGRWPTNVLLTHQPLVDDTGNIIGDACADGCVPGCPVADMDAQSGARTSGSRKAGTYGLMGYMGADAAPMPAIAGDSGGASRFFPVFRYEAKAPSSERPRGEDGTAHATVKPLALMRWLVRLATQPGGLVLDPFLGSGTTAEACVIEGFRCIGIERDESHLPLIKARLSKPIQPALGFEDAS